jgi:hypothetical protein
MKAKAGNGCYLDGKEIERERERGRGGSKARAGNKVV